MAGKLTRFRIEALHNVTNIDVSIQDNKLILVGENGTGKSTVANLIYFFITCQWERMLQYQFDSIIAEVDSNVIQISQKEIIGRTSSRRGTQRFKGSPSLHRRVESLRRELQHSRQIYNHKDIQRLAHNYELPMELIEDYMMGPSSERLESSKNLDEAEKTLRKCIRAQVLYLPTYRRIEQELRAIFPGSDSEIERTRERIRHRPDRDYVELVEFGMEDVEKTIQSKVSAIKENVLNGLRVLTGTYLRDVIRDTYRSVDLMPMIRGLKPETMETIIRRIPEDILPVPDQVSLRGIINRIKASGSIADEDKVIAHFLAQLVELHQKQQRGERDIQRFIKVCNDYHLLGKKIVYDNISFDIYVRQVMKDGSHKRLPLRALSSGEKQLVSLFSHIYLSGATGFFLIMDEPELSLSVSWQRRLLPDILSTRRCRGLIAVTHSPFIFDNQFDHSAHSLEEFMVSSIQ